LSTLPASVQSAGAFLIEDALFPSPESTRRLLLEGYAFSWLGMVPDSDPLASEERHQKGGLAASSALTYAVQPLGSRLPAPPDWTVWEAAGAPRAARHQKKKAREEKEDGPEASPSSSAAAALLLSIGLEECGAKWHSRCPANLRLRASFLMVFGPEASPGAAAMIPPGVEVRPFQHRSSP
jgi:hypothetical protein